MRSARAGIQVILADPAGDRDGDADLPQVLGKLGRDHAVDGLVGPVDRGSGPPPVLAEPAAVVPQLAVVYRQVLPLLQPGADRPVRHDAEQPRAQRRPALETVEATEQPQPRVLRYLFGDCRAPHVAAGEPDHRRVMAVDQAREGLLVAGPQAPQQLAFIGTARRGMLPLTVRACRDRA